MNWLFFLHLSGIDLPHLTILPPDLMTSLVCDFMQAFFHIGTSFQMPELWGIKSSLKKGAINLIDKSIGDDQMDSFRRVLSLSGSGDKAISWGTFWKVVNSAVGIVKPFGFALVTTYFLVYMFDAAAKEQLTFESIVKVLIQLVIVIGVIANMERIVNAILSFSESIFVKVSSNKIGKASTSIKPEDVVDGMLSGGGEFAAFMSALMVWIIHQLAVIALDFAAIIRMIELGWRIAMMPVGVANCFEGGTSSPAVKYVKSLFAVALSGAVLYVIGLTGFSVVGTFLSEANDFSGLLLAQSALLGTAGAAIMASNKVKDITA
jgi:hypothetical protein